MDGRVESREGMTVGRKISDRKKNQPTHLLRRRYPHLRLHQRLERPHRGVRAHLQKMRCMEGVSLRWR